MPTFLASDSSGVRGCSRREAAREAKSEVELSRWAGQRGGPGRDLNAERTLEVRSSSPRRTWPLHFLGQEPHRASSGWPR